MSDDKVSPTTTQALQADLWSFVKSQRDAAYDRLIQAQGEVTQAQVDADHLNSLLARMKEAGMNDHLPTIDDVQAAFGSQRDSKPTEPPTAERLARHAHNGQVDKAGQPYIGHIERVVVNLLRRWPDATEAEIDAAWLHDVIEDTSWDAFLLKQVGISSEAVAIIEELTRPEGSTYLAWIQTLSALGSVSAVKIKLADNEDNSDPERVNAIPQGAAMLKDRYVPARRFLENRLQAEGVLS